MPELDPITTQQSTPVEVEVNQPAPIEEQQQESLDIEFPNAIPYVDQAVTENLPPAEDIEKAGKVAALNESARKLVYGKDADPTQPVYAEEVQKRLPGFVENEAHRDKPLVEMIHERAQREGSAPDQDEMQEAIQKFGGALDAFVDNSLIKGRALDKNLLKDFGYTDEDLHVKEGDKELTPDDIRDLIKAKVQFEDFSSYLYDAMLEEKGEEIQAALEEEMDETQIGNSGSSATEGEVQKPKIINLEKTDFKQLLKDLDGSIGQGIDSAVDFADIRKLLDLVFDVKNGGHYGGHYGMENGYDPKEKGSHKEKAMISNLTKLSESKDMATKFYSKLYFNEDSKSDLTSRELTKLTTDKLEQIDQSGDKKEAVVERFKRELITAFRHSSPVDFGSMEITDIVLTAEVMKAFVLLAQSYDVKSVDAPVQPEVKPSVPAQLPPDQKAAA
jgi:hypothetical protein